MRNKIRYVAHTTCNHFECSFDSSTLQKHFNYSVIPKILTSMLWLLFLLLGSKSFSQSTFTVEMQHLLNVPEALKLVKNNSTTDNTDVAGILSDTRGATISISVFEKYKYDALPEGYDNKKDAFLFGMINDPDTESADTYQNIPFVLTPRYNWRCWGFSTACHDPFESIDNTDLYSSNDYKIFKKAILAIRRPYEDAPEINFYDDSSNFYLTRSKYAPVVVVIKITTTNPTYPASLQRLVKYKVPGLGGIYPNIERWFNVKVYRGDQSTPVENLDFDANVSQNVKNELTVFEGDSLVFKSYKPLKIDGLTDVSIMRWAGESLYMTHTITDDKHKPFLFFDSNVHGIKMRSYPEEWKNGKHVYPSWQQSTVNNVTEYTYYHIANGRRDHLRDNNEDDENSNVKLKAYKEASEFGIDHFPNQNKFSGTLEKLKKQRNNQKEGLNLEVLYAHKYGLKGIAGLDPDEIIYKEFQPANSHNGTSFSDITSNINSLGNKQFTYVRSDFWKKMETGGAATPDINSSLKYALKRIGKFLRDGDTEYKYDGFEILDQNLFINKTTSEMIDNKIFDNTVKQPMFNNKIPIYYNPSFFNKPIYKAEPSLQIDFGTKDNFCIEYTVLSPLEGKRRGVPYNSLSNSMRMDPLVNFYGIINGPTYLARYQKNATYTVANLPNLNDVPGLFELVYANEDSNGFMNYKRKVVSGEDPRFVLDEFGGGGYHEMTLYYYRTKNTNTTPVIIAGKELIDIDLRFIFSPNSEDGADFSFNPMHVFGSQNDAVFQGKARLAENKGTGKRWFLNEQNPKMIANGYGLEHGYDDHNVVRTYVLSTEEALTLTVLDADPHNFTHYSPDWYISERRMSKRLTDAQLKDPYGDAKITWHKSSSPDFSSETLVGYGKHFTLSSSLAPTVNQSVYVRAKFNGAADIAVKVIFRFFGATIINSSQPLVNQNIGDVKTYELSDTQFSVFKSLAGVDRVPPTKSKDDYFILRVNNLFSRYVYGQENENFANTNRAPRYKAGPNGTEVGEHKRFSPENNFDARFTWSFFNDQYIADQNFTFDFSNANDYDDASIWFPKNWIRHLDGQPQSPEIPIFTAGHPNFSVFDKSVPPNIRTYRNSTSPLVENWQVRLPWIAQSGLHGYKTRWNIKAIYSIDNIFNRSLIGTNRFPGINSQDFNTLVNGVNGSNIIPNYTPEYREREEFFWHLKTKRMMIIDREALQNFLRQHSSLDNGNLRVHVKNPTGLLNPEAIVIFGASVEIPVLANMQVRGAVEEPTDQVLLDNNVVVYPNVSNDGVFNVNIVVEKTATATGSMILYDALGKLIYNYGSREIKGDLQVKIGEDLHLATGIYFLKITINNVSTTKKLIVQ